MRENLKTGLCLYITGKKEIFYLKLSINSVSLVLHFHRVDFLKSQMVIAVGKLVYSAFYTVFTSEKCLVVHSWHSVTSVANYHVGNKGISTQSVEYNSTPMMMSRI